MKLYSGVAILVLEFLARINCYVIKDMGLAFGSGLQRPVNPLEVPMGLLRPNIHAEIPRGLVQPNIPIEVPRSFVQPDVPKEVPKALPHPDIPIVAPKSPNKAPVPPGDGVAFIITAPYFDGTVPYDGSALYIGCLPCHITNGATGYKIC
ncbi:hypothetical protein SK128_004404 [Halocaridina rubra]|uniref:Uncharacterized protein n=1 Tax=Halocaridina rubra TaxID=373956 RepID=A0AAN8ZY55_HALRR